MTTETKTATVVSTGAPAGATTPTVAPAAYNALVASAHLRDIKLIQSEFILDPDGLSDQSSWKQKHSCEIENSYYDLEDGLLIAWVSASATCIKDEKDVVVSKCKYVVIYRVGGKPDDLAVGAFAKRVARFAVYPYFRAHFAGMTAQAGLHLPPLPVIKEKRLIQNLEGDKTGHALEHISEEVNSQGA